MKIHVERKIRMSLFTINQEKCKRDGICVKDCPSQVIILEDKNAFPKPTEDAEEFCIRCGHCVAICPHDAFNLSSMPLTECQPLQKDLLPRSEAIRQFLRTRRSIRQYRKKPVPHGLLTELIDTARYAPTGSNKQQVNWIVIEDPAQIHQLAAIVIDFTKLMIPALTDNLMIRRMGRINSAWDHGEDRIMREAPNLILVHAPSDLPFTEADCVTALAYLELYAYAQGLGTCWAGYFTTAANFYAPLAELLALPPKHRCYGAVMIGYPKCEYKRIPQRNEALVTWI
jgi:nitroreductase/NAD-dependent dihydropyrimidine dehydrogenase PreA subunit